MDTEPPFESQPGVTLRTADELFARPDCTHIITMNNPNQNLHLERTPEGFRFTAGSPGAERHYSSVVPSLDDVYREWDVAPRRYSLREAIWQDISEYPAFPYSALYLPLDGPIELHVLPDNENVTTHGPHAVYGPASIASAAPHTYLVTVASGWLVVERPAFTFRGQVSQAIIRPTRNIFDRLRLNVENHRLRHDKRIQTRVRPGVTVVYGKPPADWQAMRQLLPAEPPAPPA